MTGLGVKAVLGSDLVPSVPARCQGQGLGLPELLVSHTLQWHDNTCLTG